MMQDEASSPLARLIIIANGHALVREGIRLMLARESDIAVVDEAKTA
ncbi:MAG: hypothetical protein M3254_00535 [Actinomycetota bacterium]|nr:hypothetical protein [Actinomycetota bacterium]